MAEHAVWDREVAESYSATPTTLVVQQVRDDGFSYVFARLKVARSFEELVSSRSGRGVLQLFIRELILEDLHHFAGNRISAPARTN